MIKASEKSEQFIIRKNLEKNIFSENLRVLLSSYTRAINKQEDRTGSLFQQNTKIKPLNDVFYGKISKPGSIGYDYYCFHYIHNNPVAHGIVKTKEKWEFSSYIDYYGSRNSSLINKNLAREILSVDEEPYSIQKTKLHDIFMAT